MTERFRLPKRLELSDEFPGTRLQNFFALPYLKNALLEFPVFENRGFDAGHIRLVSGHNAERHPLRLPVLRPGNKNQQYMGKMGAAGRCGQDSF